MLKTLQLILLMSVSTFFTQTAQASFVYDFDCGTPIFCNSSGSIVVSESAVRKGGIYGSELLTNIDSLSFNWFRAASNGDIYRLSVTEQLLNYPYPQPYLQFSEMVFNTDFDIISMTIYMGDVNSIKPGASWATIFFDGAVLSTTDELYREGVSGGSWVRRVPAPFSGLMLVLGFAFIVIRAHKKT